MKNENLVGGPTRVEGFKEGTNYKSEEREQRRQRSRYPKILFFGMEAHFMLSIFDS